MLYFAYAIEACVHTELLIYVLTIASPCCIELCRMQMEGPWKPDQAKYLPTDLAPLSRGVIEEVDGSKELEDKKASVKAIRRDSRTTW